MTLAQVAELICALHMPFRKKEGKLLKWYMQDPAVQKRRENCVSLLYAMILTCKKDGKAVFHFHNPSTKKGGEGFVALFCDMSLLNQK